MVLLPQEISLNWDGRCGLVVLPGLALASVETGRLVRRAFEPPCELEAQCPVSDTPGQAGLDSVPSSGEQFPWVGNGAQHLALLVFCRG